MSYALFWIELLVVLLLWFASAAALAARVRRKPMHILLIWFLWALPAGGLTAISLLTGILKFKIGLRVSWFGFATCLFAAFLIGTLVILIAGRRRKEPGLARAASSWPVKRLLLALCVAGALTAMTLWNMDLAVRSEAAGVRTEAGALLLAVVPPNVPDEQNAAVIYEKAFARLEADRHRRDEDYPLEEDAPDVRSPAVQKFLENHELTLRLLRQAAGLPICRFEHDYARPSFTMLLPEVQWARMSAALLALDARQALAHAHVDQAMIDVNAILRLGQGMGDQPLIITSLVASGIDSIGTSLLQEVLPAVTTEQQLSLVHVSDEEAQRRMFRRCIQGEEAFGLTTFCDLAGGTISLEQINGGPANLSPPGESILLRVFFMPQDLVGYRRMMQNFRAAAAQPYNPSQASADDEARNSGLLTSIVAPALSKFLKADAMDEAEHADATVALALTHYRLDHGGYPPDLAALVPKYLDDVPQDPFDAKPLRFLVAHNQCVIYSVGPDQKDDGGRPLDHKTETGDIVFSMPLGK